MTKFALSIECKSELDATLFTAWLLDALEMGELLETLDKSGDPWNGTKCVGTCERKWMECVQ